MSFVAVDIFACLQTGRGDLEVELMVQDRLYISNRDAQHLGHNPGARRDYVQSKAISFRSALVSI
jgi:hypothetical protein